MTAARKPTRWLALARLSDKWRDDPLERQTADLLDVVERNGGELIEPVLVERVSGSQYRPKTHTRPGWERIMEAVTAGEVDGVAVYNLDRLTREPFAAEQLIRAAEAGLKVADPATTTDLANGDARHFFRGKIAAAAAESDSISRRTRRAFEAKRGDRPFWSFRPFGFQRDGSHDPREAQILRDAYARFVNGDTLGAIAAWLNAEGITQPERTDREGNTIAKPWTGGAVRNLLKADRNAGVLRSFRGDREPQPGGWEAIVDHDTFQAARRLLDTNASRKAADGAGNRRSHLLSGLLVCGVCGRSLTSLPRTNGQVSYACRLDRRAGRMGCGLTVSAPRVEEIVRDEVLRWLADEGYREAIAAHDDTQTDAVQLLAVIQNAKDRKKALVRRTRGADATLTLDDIDDELADLAAQQKQAQAKLDRSRAVAPRAYLPDSDDPELLAEGWDDMTLAQRQAMIADVLEPVVVNKGSRGSVFDRSRVVCLPRYPAADEAAA